jgi:DNA repair photolyase
MKTINGKAIYSPKGKAGEYAEYACNLYVGCPHGCTYCYLRKGVLATAMGGDKPTLKKCFRDEAHALEVFEKELKANLPEMQKHGLFFSFTSDFALPECYNLTMKAVDICVDNNVPVKLLTKRADWVDEFLKD